MAHPTGRFWVNWAFPHGPPETLAEECWFGVPDREMGLGRMDGYCDECMGEYDTPGDIGVLMSKDGEIHCRPCWAAHWHGPCKSCYEDGEASGEWATDAFGLCSTCEDDLDGPAWCSSCWEAGCESQAWPQRDLQWDNAAAGWACPTCVSEEDAEEEEEVVCEACGECIDEEEWERETPAEQNEHGDSWCATCCESAQGQVPPPATPEDGRARNLRDIMRLRGMYPKHCSHHTLYYHVLGRGTGCSRAAADADGCMQGGIHRSHDIPPNLLSCGLEAVGA